MNLKKINQILTSPIFILISISLLLFLVTMNKPMDNDEGLWIYIARAWVDHGILPYVGAVENKTPGIFELYALSYFIFGAKVIFIRIIGILAIAANMIFLLKIATKLHSRLAGIFAMYILGLSYTWHLLYATGTAYPETFIALFTTLSFFFVIDKVTQNVWKWPVFLSGLAMGLAITFKQIAFLSLFALVIFVIFFTLKKSNFYQKLLAIVLIGAGVLVSTLVGLFPLLISGVSVMDYIDGAWLILLNSGSMATLVDRMYRFFGIWFGSRITVFYFPLLILALYPKILKKRYFIFLLIWLFFDFLGVNASGNYFGHHLKQLMPSLSLIVGILLSQLINLVNVEKSEKKIAQFVIVLVLVLFPYQEVVINGYLKGYPDDDKALAHWIRENTLPNDRVFLFGGTTGAIMGQSERLAPSKFYNSVFVTTHTERSQLLKDFKANPPKLFVVEKNQAHLRPLIDAEFFEDYTFSLTKFDYDIYTLNR